MAEFSNGESMLLPDMNPIFQQASKIPEIYQNAQVKQQQLQQEQQATQKGQIGLDELQATQPARLYSAYAGAAEKAGPGQMSGQAGGQMGLDDLTKNPNQAIDMHGAFKDAHELTSSPEWQKMSNEEKQKAAIDLLRDNKVDHDEKKFGMQDLSPPIGTVHMAPDGSTVVLHNQRLDLSDLSKFKETSAAKLESLPEPTSAAGVKGAEAREKEASQERRTQETVAGRENVANTNKSAKIETKEAPAGASPGRMSGDQVKLDNAQLADLAKVIKPDAFGRPPADAKQKAIAIFANLKTQDAKNRAMAAYPQFLGPPKIAPVATGAPPVSGPSPIIVQGPGGVRRPFSGPESEIPAGYTKVQ